MIPLRDEARRLAKEAADNLRSDGWPAVANDFESALLAFAKLVLEREPSEAMRRAFGNAYNDTQTGVSPLLFAYRAMTAELLRELE